MAKLINLLTPNRVSVNQMTRRDYNQHIEQTQYHMPAYLELSRHISINI